MLSSNEDPIKAYQTQGTTSGTFRELGSTHLHLDVESKHAVELMNLVRHLEGHGIPSKINLVHGFIAGPQREATDLGKFYDSHTPTSPDSGEESFGIFSTSLVRGREEVLMALREIFRRFEGTGGVAEFEQVVGRGDTKNRRPWRELGTTDNVRPIGEEEIGKKSDISATYEIHHGFNIASKEIPFDLSQLLEIEDVMVGGWFVSRRETNGGEWAFRSNAFSDAPDETGRIKDRMRREQAALQAFLDKNRFEDSVSTTLERTLGVWHLN